MPQTLVIAGITSTLQADIRRQETTQNAYVPSRSDTKTTTCRRAGVTLFLGQWNNFSWPLLVAPSPDLRVVQVAVSIIGVEQQINLWEQMFASSTLAMLAPALLILPVQKFYVGGILGSGLKGG